MLVKPIFSHQLVRIMDTIAALAARREGERSRTQAPKPGCRERAVKPISRSQWNDGFGADSGPSRGDACRRALRPWTKPLSR